MDHARKFKGADTVEKRRGQDVEGIHDDLGEKCGLLVILQGVWRRKAGLKRRDMAVSEKAQSHTAKSNCADGTSGPSHLPPVLPIVSLKWLRPQIGLR